jgi:uncharacterized protein (DUF1697 family)
VTRYVAFLRAINVGGHVVKMDALRARFEKLGYSRVETFIASGNVIFETSTSDPPRLERRIEQALEEALGYEVATFLRTPKEVAAIARAWPFAAAATAKARALNVALLKEPLDETARRSLATLRSDLDDFEVRGTELYWLCRGKQNESKVSNVAMERALKVKVTIRGLRTMEKLAEKFPPTS